MLKTIAKVSAGILMGILGTLILILQILPFEYQYDKTENSMVFTVKNETVTDYTTLKRDSNGSTFKVWFEHDSIK